MPIVIDTTTRMVIEKMKGCVVFIKMLLLISGVEPNPGPKDEVFTFRYQYLLVEHGTNLLRSVFKQRVGENFNTYLEKHQNDKTQLENLLKKPKMFTEAQKKILPPEDKAPSPDNYDITLLCCLLRNACGLAHFKDNVWNAQDPSDTSLEAEITRFRKMRNQLMHSGSVQDSEADMEVKLKQLCSTMRNIGSHCDIDVEPLISDAETVDIDKKKKERQQELQQMLIQLYQINCCRLTISPLTDENQQLLQIYQLPSLSVVDYHRARVDQKPIEVARCQDIFFKDQKPCKEIYITGDAGVGKSSYCSYMSLLWSTSKHGGVKIDNKRMQEDADFLAEYDFVFHVKLCATKKSDVIAMLVDELLGYSNKDTWSQTYTTVKQILESDFKSLIILDGLDEYSAGKPENKIPKRLPWEKCTFVTTCRPYKIENVRLTPEQLDQQVQMTGIHGDSMKTYVTEIVNYANVKYGKDKKAEDFLTEVEKCGLKELLCVPIIASHLVIVWFSGPLTKMSRSMIYGKIVDMLFKLAVEKNVAFPPQSSSAQFKLPGCLSNLQYLNAHFTLLEKVCLLSFTSLFQSDDSATNLVFTMQQLVNEPYLMSHSEVDTLFKVGILSKNKVCMTFGELEHKLSFIHKSYLEFLAAVYVSNLDTSQYSDIFKDLTTLDQVIQLENFFLFFAGLASVKQIECLFDLINSSLSDSLTTCRTNAIFHPDCLTHWYKLRSLQNIVISCYKESSILFPHNVHYKLEHYIFDSDSNDHILKEILLLNLTSVKSIHSVNGRYKDEFNDITNLDCFDIHLSSDLFDKRFTELMLRNKSTLRSISIYGKCKLIPELPVKCIHHVMSLFTQNRYLHHIAVRYIHPVLSLFTQNRYLQQLTSLSMVRVEMKHEHLHSLVTFISHNVLFENIILDFVKCEKHSNVESCTLSLDMHNHKHLTTLNLKDVNIVCQELNSSSLKSLTLYPSSEMIGCYVDVFNSIKSSQIEHIDIHGRDMLDNNTVKVLAATITTLPCLKSLTLASIQFPVDVILQFNADLIQAEIIISHVTISRKWFDVFISSILNSTSLKRISLWCCFITPGESSTESSTGSCTGSVTESITESVTRSVTESITESVTRSDSESGTESGTVSGTVSGTDSCTDSWTGSVSEGVTGSVSRSVTGSVTESGTVSGLSLDELKKREKEREKERQKLWKESVNYMADRVSQHPSLNITYKCEGLLDFETSGYQ